MHLRLTLTSVLLAGCILQTPGVRKAIDFQAVVDDQVVGGWEVAAIAPGTVLTVRMMAHARQDPLLVTEWMVSDPSVIAAEREAEDRLRLIAHRPGTSKLLVRAGEVEDWIEIVVMQPVATDVFPPFSLRSKAEPVLAALTGQAAELPLMHRGPNRESVLALGIPPPVLLEPSGVAKAIPPGPKSGARLHLSFERPGALTLSGGAGPTLDVDVVDAAQIDGVYAERVWEPTDPSMMTYAVMVDTLGRRAVLVTGGFTVEVTTPQMCALASEEQTLETKRIHGLGAFTVTSLQAGACEGVVKVGRVDDRFSVELKKRSPEPSAEPRAQRR